MQISVQMPNNTGQTSQTFHTLMLVLPVLQGKDRDPPQVCGREFLNSCYLLGLRGSRLAVPQRLKSNMHSPLQKGHRLGCPAELLPELPRQRDVSPTPGSIENNCQLLRGG